MEYIYSFEKLRVWQNARQLSLRIYRLSEKFPQSEKFGLTNQLRRAAVSVSANLAEGTSRTTGKDQAHFTTISYGSLMEVLNHLYLCHDLNYLSKDDLNELAVVIKEMSNQLNSLRKRQLNKD
ncbi:MAG: four helix bundle protein [Ignavibacteriaceae bacterium]|jgi:four helix bundle protein|nr:four helix bundle protein [Ignavibacteriaceae bacterium]